MEKGLYYPNDNLTCRCEFTISAGKIWNDIQELKISAPTVSPSLDHMNSLTSALQHLFAEQKFCDVTLEVKNQTLKAHRAVLCARSPVFSAMFENDMKEKGSGVIVITDMDKSTLHQMLMFLYTDTLNDLQFDSAMKLFAASDKYQIMSLGEKCLTFLKCNISLRNFGQVLVLGDMHLNDELKAAAQNFIRKNMHDALKSDSWKVLVENSFDLAVETLRKIFDPSSCI